MTDTVSANPGDVLVGNVGVWTSVDGVDGYAYQAYRNGSPIPGYGGNWPGTDAKYVVQLSDVGATIYFAIWASNRDGTSAAINTNPVVVLAPLNALGILTGDELGLVDGTDALGVLNQPGPPPGTGGTLDLSDPSQSGLTKTVIGI